MVFEDRERYFAMYLPTEQAEYEAVKFSEQDVMRRQSLYVGRFSEGSESEFEDR